MRQRVQIGVVCLRSSLGMVLVGCGASTPPTVSPASYHDDPAVSYQELAVRAGARMHPGLDYKASRCAAGDGFQCVLLGEDFAHYASADAPVWPHSVGPYDSPYVKPFPIIETAMRIWQAACTAGTGPACYRLGEL